MLFGSSGKCILIIYGYIYHIMQEGHDVFSSDWWEVFVISGCYEMGDPLAPSEVEGNREGGDFTRS